jgi:hypothetical protein
MAYRGRPPCCGWVHIEAPGELSPGTERHCSIERQTSLTALWGRLKLWSSQNKFLYVRMAAYSTPGNKATRDQDATKNGGTHQ